MATYTELQELLAETDPVKEAVQTARQYPIEVLRRICAGYIKTGQPVADHQLGLNHYVAETALRALVAAGLVEVQSPPRQFMRTFKPTEKALEYYQKLEQEQAAAKGVA